MTAFGISS